MVTGRAVSSWITCGIVRFAAMRALVLTAPRAASVQDVPDPRPGPGQALVAVARVGLCGTDEELFDGSMAYFATGRAQLPAPTGPRVGRGRRGGRRGCGRRPGTAGG